MYLYSFLLLHVERCSRKLFRSDHILGCGMCCLCCTLRYMPYGVQCKHWSRYVAAPGQQIGSANSMAIKWRTPPTNKICGLYSVLPWLDSFYVECTQQQTTGHRPPATVHCFVFDHFFSLSFIYLIFFSDTRKLHRKWYQSKLVHWLLNNILYNQTSTESKLQCEQSKLKCCKLSVWSVLLIVYDDWICCFVIHMILNYIYCSVFDFFFLLFTCVPSFIGRWT